MIIGFTGAAGAGKDTCANIASYLLQKNSVSCITIACADPLKRICRDVLGTSYNVPATAFYGSQADKKRELENLPIRAASGDRWNGRQIMQFLGTDCFQQLAPDIWARYAINTAKELLRTQCNVVLISDVRFKQEALAIKNTGGNIIRVDRPKISSKDDHISEKEYEELDVDFVIRNESDSLEDLEYLVKDVLCKLDFLLLT